MSYTNAEQVRHHLAVERPVLERITDQTLTLKGLESISFFGGPVSESNLAVKSPRSVLPQRTSLTLVVGDNVLAGTPLVRDSVLVASDPSQSVLYTENLDFVVDYSAASLRLKTGGSLVSGQSITVWFRTYALYSSGSDYTVDPQRGTIKRLAGGEIAQGETVLIDYTPITGGVTDDIINDAVTAANGLVETQVDPNSDFVSDPILTAAATFCALEFVCRAAAARELGSRKGDDRTALAWIKLAADYSDRAQQLVSNFRSPLSGPAKPKHT